MAGMLCPHGRRSGDLVTRFPEKAPELWDYQTTIFKAAHAYEGSTWVAYDRQFRREMLARKDLNWLVPDARLYNEAFTGRARSIPRCPHCLSEDHTAVVCPFNPNPPIVGWLQDPRPFVASTAAPAQPQGSSLGMTTAAREVCRNFNMEKCYLTRCRFAHTCFECQGHHPATRCPQGPASHGRLPVGRGRGRGRQAAGHPYRPYM